MKKLFICLFCFIYSFCAVAQQYTIEQYVEKYKNIAVNEMKRMGIPAAITLAQGILETENGNSKLVKKSNNHFGIKCKNTWTGETVTHDDDSNNECFRSYKTAEDSYRDHSNFLRGTDRYAFLFHLDAKDYRGWAYGLKKAGYATNPNYPEILIKNIEQYNLQQYTLLAINDVPDFNAAKFENKKEVKVKPVATETNIENITNNNVKGVADEADKIVTINRCKCVFAKKGTSLLAIAIKNNINLNNLLDFNEIYEDGIVNKGQYVYLQKKQKMGEQDYCIVKSGESIYDIAQNNGIQLQFILNYNNLNDGDVALAGTRLILRPGSKATEVNQESDKIKMHRVAAKEGLFGIAKKYKVTVKQLKDWNNLEEGELKVGQDLIIAK